MMQPVLTAAVVLAGQARSAGAARRFLSETLAIWGAPQYEETAQLLISELVTNAVLHARTDITVRLELGPANGLQGPSGPTRLRLEVSDASARQPVTRHYSLEATTGRGLALIDALAGRWGVDRLDQGKTVWAELSENEPERRSRPDVEVDLAAFPDLEPGTAQSGSAPGPVILGRAA